MNHTKEGSKPVRIDIGGRPLTRGETRLAKEVIRVLSDTQKARAAAAIQDYREVLCVRPRR